MLAAGVGQGDQPAAALGGHHDQALVLEQVDRRVDGAGARGPHAAGALGDRLHDLVAVHRLLGDEQQHGGADVAARSAAPSAAAAAHLGPVAEGRPVAAGVVVAAAVAAAALSQVSHGSSFCPTCPSRDSNDISLLSLNGREWPARAPHPRPPAGGLRPRAVAARQQLGPLPPDVRGRGLRDDRPGLAGRPTTVEAARQGPSVSKMVQQAPTTTRRSGLAAGVGRSASSPSGATSRAGRADQVSSKAGNQRLVMTFADALTTAR